MQELETKANHIRRTVLRMITQANSGHPGGSLSAADLLTVLFFDEMDLNEENVGSINRDRFILSKGHASALLYAVLYEKGLLKEEELGTFRKIDSRLQGHPDCQKLIGVDMSTGSLGQGLSVGVGMAIANKLDYNPHRIYVLMGDGECEEGQVYEAMMAASQYHLDNLCVIIDHNGLQIDGPLKAVMDPMPLDEKFKAFQWNVVTCDGHDIHAIQDALAKARLCETSPTMILAHTIKGKGVSFMENRAEWHGKAPNPDQCAAALRELGEKNE